MEDEDYLLALRLQEELNGEDNIRDSLGSRGSRPKAPSKTSIIDSEWEVNDPNPDIHLLFRVFNVKFFWDTLGSVEIKWSPRMYSCAGICTYKGRAGCVVSLSLPLLKFRPRKDLVETLLHEMIHAYLFITKNFKDRSSHGPEFCNHMGRINKEAGTHITIYHSFHDEVRFYQTHVWRCNGSCRANPPYFGYVRRAMNRAPGPYDFWFAEHKRTCGGTFDKVEEPDNFKPRKTKKGDSSGEKSNVVKKKTPAIDRSQKDLRTFFPSGSSNQVLSDPKKNSVPKKDPVNVLRPNNQSNNIVKHGGLKNNIFGFNSLTNKTNESESGGPREEVKSTPPRPTIVPFSGKGYTLGGSSETSSGPINRFLPDQPRRENPMTTQPGPSQHSSSQHSPSQHVVDLTEMEVDFVDSSSGEEESEDCIQCPVCSKTVKRSSINGHLDECAQLERVLNSTNTTVMSDSDSDTEYQPPSPPVSCPKCSANLTASTINRHLDQCLTYD